MNQISPDSAMPHQSIADTLIRFLASAAPYILLIVVIGIAAAYLMRLHRPVPELGNRLASVKPIDEETETQVPATSLEEEEVANRQNGAIVYDGFDMNVYARRQTPKK